VEHSLPKIGEHARDVFPTQQQPDQRASAQTAPLSFSGPQDAPLVISTKRLALLTRLSVAVKVPDLERAERYYIDFLGMNLLGRERRDDHGELEEVERDYSATHALAAGREADVSYLANGPVTIALVRVGRGARLEPAGGPPLAVEVDEPTFQMIKGEAYMRGSEILGDLAGRFTVRDIFGMVWQFATPADVPALTS
jgi:catechol 2,3-dioxygenase-like lactoylglutathione lyase family enzyme